MIKINIELHCSSGWVALCERFPNYVFSPLLISDNAHWINRALVCPLSELLQIEQKIEGEVISDSHHSTACLTYPLESAQRFGPLFHV